MGTRGYTLHAKHKSESNNMTKYHKNNKPTKNLLKSKQKAQLWVKADINIWTNSTTLHNMYHSSLDTYLYENSNNRHNIWEFKISTKDWQPKNICLCNTRKSSTSNRREWWYSKIYEKFQSTYCQGDFKIFTRK